MINAASERHSIECNKYPYLITSNHISHLVQNGQLRLIFLPKPPSNLKMLSSSAWAIQEHLRHQWQALGGPSSYSRILATNNAQWFFQRMVHLASMPNALRIWVPETPPVWQLSWSRHSSMSLRLLFLRLNIQESACLQHLVAVGIPNDQNGNLH